MKAYAISSIITIPATEVDPEGHGPKVMQYPVNWAATISADHESNPNKRWMLVVVSGTEAQIAELDADSDIDILPFAPDQLDQPWESSMTVSDRNKVSAFTNSRTGVKIDRDDKRSVREVITEVGLQIDPNFNPDNLDIAE